MADRKMKSGSWIIVELLGALVFLCTLGFFFNPAYEKGVYAIVGALILALGNALGTKSGSSLPQQAANGGSTPTPQPGNGGTNSAPKPPPPTPAALYPPLT